MSEGELHKRIMDQLWMEIGNTLQTMSISLYSEGIKNVVEEMKADFPEIRYIDHDTDGEVLGWDEVDSDEAIKWFKKWLGEKEKRSK